MADTAALIFSGRAEGPESEPDSSLFHRRIEFHRARKSFSGFVNESSNGFKLVTLNPTSDPAKLSGLARKSKKSSEVGLDPELTFEISFRKIGAGLHNLGNTCFLNSVLQCLTYTAPLAAYLQSGKHQNSCRTAGFCVLCAIQKHVSRALQSTGRSLEPKEFVSNMRCISRSFQMARQEDAHEYMVNLLESMHKCCLPSGVPSESPSAYEKSLVHKIFGGRLRSQVKCMQCSYCSNKFDPFLDLSLEIAKAESLYKALGHFTAKEQLDGGARVYKCEQCNQKVKALKQLTIDKAPEVLAVHLKRFSALTSGEKINRKVAFGPTLDLKPFVSGPNDGDLNYTLYGVLVHRGYTTRSGHYYCFVRTSSGMWYSLDDNQVAQVNERTVLEQKAYMLFYVRDRKNGGLKNHANARQKENMVINAIGTAAYSKLNLDLKKRLQNGSHEKNLSDSFSAALSGRDALVTPLATENMDSNLNGKLTAEHLNSVDHKGDSCSNGAISGGTSNLVPAAGNITGNNNLSVAEEQNTTANMMPDCGRSQNTFHKKESSNIVAKPNSAEKPPSSSVLSTSSRDSCKTDGTISKMNSSKIVPNGEINHLPPSTVKSIGDEQVGSSSTKTAGLNTQDTVENGHGMGMQPKLSDLPVTSEPFALGTTKIKRHGLKVRRKLFKCHVTSSLSSDIIFGVGLCLRKKRHKQKRLHSMQKKSPNTKDSHVSLVPSMLGENATEESFAQVVNHCTSSQKKKANNVSDGQKRNLIMENVIDDCSISGDVNNDSRERVLLNGSAVSAEKQPEVRQLKQTDVMSLLTRGLEETTVARWDDIGVSLSGKSETETERTGDAQIGYIGDEWDEEYDRGKRKKVRESKISFGGPNLFQEIANHKSKAKKAKLNRSREGNLPFRIL